MRSAFIACALSVVAASAATGQGAVAKDTAHAVDNAGVRRGLRFGVATGALHYDGGRSEQSIGGVLRWAPVRYFSLSASPTIVRQSISTTTGTLASSVSRSGLTDLPVTATLSHVLHSALTPVIVGSFGISLPVGDTAGGFGSGSAAYSINFSGGVSPTEATWVQAGVGHSLSGLGVQSAFTGGSSWADLGVGLTLTDRVSVDASYSTDIGSTSGTTPGSTSIGAGMDYELTRSLSTNLSVTRGLTGIAPSWSMSLGFGSAFPSLGHAVRGISSGAFGGGTHGLGTGGTSTGKGSGRKKG